MESIQIMKCKICGGELIFKNNVYECSSCNNKISLISAFEKTEVYLAYIENDENGRRTKDSIIAQELYNKLQNANIDVFYERLSCDNVVGEALFNIKNYALSAANIVVLIGTTETHFQELIETLPLSNKIILPVYTEIAETNLPKELKELQALNYNSIAAASDLIRVIYKELHRDNEYNYSTEVNEKQIKRKKRILWVTTSLITLFVVCILYFVFCTSYFLPSKKYEKAETLIDNGKYIEALNIYTSLENYADSKSKIKNIYSRYIGYYFDEEKNLSLHLDINDNIKAEIEIKQNLENGIVTILESCQIHNNSMSFSFNDSENNQGNVNIELYDESIKITIDTEQKLSDIVITGVECNFNIADKSDKPFAKKVDSDIVKKWLSKPHSKKQITSQGFDLTFLCGDQNTTWKSYAITNTDIIIDFIGREISYSFINSEYFDEEFAIAYTIPAEIVIPHKIGKEYQPYVEGNIAYLPNATFSMISQLGTEFSYDEEKLYIEADTPVVCVSKNIVNDEFWQDFLENEIYSFYLERQYKYIYGESGIGFFEFLAENDTYHLATTSSNFNIPTTPMFKINKSTYEVEFVCDIPYDSPNYQKVIDIYAYPEYFSEFYN